MKYWREPLDKDQIQVPRGVVHLIPERCKGCGFCVEFCPQKVLLMSEKTNTKGYRLPEITNDSHCLNCGLCMLLCPDFAVYVEDSGVQSAEVVETSNNDEAKR
ncbi:MAG: 4Fe-4S dicluster domain-containing protein [Deltaproteobacteria bacterium]|nr:4Fe-4S dicluster domain-containing protein [Deltaproteobacteria bacterium]MBW2152542.1 4Fe-4S dicluster domain-containing protein [Deltaproteobacteria bacterium]